MVDDIKKIFSNKVFFIELVGFVVLQVFIDMYRIFFESKHQIFGIALPELINLLYLAALTVVFFVRNLKKPKVFIPIGIYSVLLVVYLALHVLNVLRLDQGLLTGSEHNWFKEVYFIARTYVIPIFVFYYFLCSDFKQISFKKVISALSLIISSNIILTNIFKVSFICYASSLEKNSFITRNFFEWFYNPDTSNPAYMSSKGWFYMGNQIGIILLVLLVFVIMFAFESGKVFNYIVVLLNAVAMIFVSTKVAALGSCIILIVGLVFAVLFGVLLKQFSFKLKQFLIYLVVITFCFAIIPFSPMLSLQARKMDAFNTTEEQQLVKDQLSDDFESIKNDNALNGDDDPQNSIVTEEFKKHFSEYVNSSPYFFGIHPEFLKLFPVEENFEFWYDIVINQNNKQVNYRYFKSVIYEEVIKLNDNKVADKLLGIGYISNFPYSEKDYISQNIWFGYIGTILFIGPYILVAMYGVYLALKKIKECFVYQNAFFALGILMPLALAFLAGHLFYGIFSITVFAFIVASFVKFQTERYNV